MLQNLLYFLIISFFALLWGRLALYLCTPKSIRSHVQFGIEQLFLCFFTGLATISILSAWISIFAPVRFELLCIFSIPVFIVLWKKRTVVKHIKYDLAGKLTPLEIAFIISSIILFFVLSSGKVVLTDADIYHVQTIKWMHEYGTIKGLANLYPRYGYYSNWFHLISIFQLNFNHQNYTYLNNTFNIWFFLFLFFQYKSFSASLASLHKHLSFYYFILLLYFLFEWDLFRVSSSSTTNDFIISCTTILCIHLLIKLFVLKNTTIGNARTLLLLLVTAPFYKMTGFLLVGFWLVYFYYIPQKKQSLLFTITMALIAFIPFAIKNYLQTGYLFFPYSFLQLPNTKWQVPIEIVQLHNKFMYFNNLYINRGAPKFPNTDITAFSYLNDWFFYVVKEEQVLLILCLISIPITLFALPKKLKENYKLFLLIWIMSVIAIIVWLLSGPILRFSFGFLVFLAFFPSTAIIYNYFKRPAFAVCMLISALISVTYAGNKAKGSLSAENIITPVPFDKISFYTVNIKGINYNIPSPIENQPRCFDYPLPCIYQINPYLEPLGTTIKEGFKMDQNLSKEFISTYKN